MSNFQLHVWFKDIDVVHDGYCSDSGEPTYDTEYSDTIIDIPDELSPESVDADGTLNNLECLSSLEYREPHGNGYCGVYNTRQVIGAKIVEKRVNWLYSCLLENNEDDEPINDEIEYLQM